MNSNTKTHHKLDSHSPPKFNFEPWTSPSYNNFFFFRSKHTQGRERNSNTKAHYKLHSKAMKNLLSLELALKVFVYVYVSYNSKIYF